MSDDNITKWLRNATRHYHDTETTVRESRRLYHHVNGKWSLKSDHYARQVLVMLSCKQFRSPSRVPLTVTIILPLLFPIHAPIVIIKAHPEHTLPFWMRQSVDCHGRMYSNLHSGHNEDLLSLAKTIEKWIGSEPVTVGNRHFSLSPPLSLSSSNNNNNNNSHANLCDKLRLKMNQLYQDCEREQQAAQRDILNDMKIVEENKQSQTRSLQRLEEYNDLVHLQLATIRSHIDHHRDYLAKSTTENGDHHVVWCKEEREQRLLEMYIRDMALSATIHSCYTLFTNRNQSPHNQHHNDSLADVLSVCRRLSRQLYLSRHEFNMNNSTMDSDRK